MPIKLNEAVTGNLLEKNYEKALSIGNRYSFLNANIFSLLNKEEQNLLLEFQGYYKKLNKEIKKKTEDVYVMFPKLGEKHLLQRMNPYDGIKGSCKAQLLLQMASSQASAELDMAAAASAILVGNSLFHNPKRTDVQEKALSEIYRGTAVGGIGITEPEHGSDAVNMKMHANISESGDVTYKGTKIYTTNGAVADYFSTYGVTDISNPRRTMMLTLFERGMEGLSTERLNIPAAIGVGIARVKYDNVTVPKENVLAAPGDGYRRLFRGLTPERMCIVGGAIGGIWASIAHAAIYTQVRHQFGKPLFKYQGISHTISDLYSRAAAYTAFAFQVADFYDKKIASKIHKGEAPNKMDEGTAAVLAAQAKYLTSKMAHEAAYECVQVMGGRGAISEEGSNNTINRGENLSRITEVLGGHRNIQLMIIEAGLKMSTAMSINRNVRKAKKNQRKTQEKIVELYISRAEKMLGNQYISDKTKATLKSYLNKLNAAIESDDKVEYKAYSRALPKMLRKAGKEVYLAKKDA